MNAKNAIDVRTKRLQVLLQEFSTLKNELDHLQAGNGSLPQGLEQLRHQVVDPSIAQLSRLYTILSDIGDPADKKGQVPAHERPAPSTHKSNAKKTVKTFF